MKRIRKFLFGFFCLFISVGLCYASRSVITIPLTNNTGARPITVASGSNYSSTFLVGDAIYPISIVYQLTTTGASAAQAGLYLEQSLQLPVQEGFSDTLFASNSTTIIGSDSQVGTWFGVSITPQPMTYGRVRINRVSGNPLLGVNLIVSKQVDS